MELNLIEEVKLLLDSIERFKAELFSFSEKRKGFLAASNHIDTAIEESEEAVKRVIDLVEKTIGILNETLSALGNGNISLAERNVSESVNLLLLVVSQLEFQDIIAQRLLKVKGFLADIEKNVLRIADLVGVEETGGRENSELEWKREISQNGVDEIIDSMRKEDEG